MAHRIPNHGGKCRRIHGHRYRLEVILSGDNPTFNAPGATTEGMVIDFGDVKNILKERIHEPLDHQTLLHDRDPVWREYFSHGDRGPEYGVITLPFVPTAENLAKWCLEQIRPELPEYLEVTVRLWESPSSYAEVTGR